METLKPRTESLNFRTKAGSLPRNPFRSHLFPNILCVLNVQLVQSLDVIVHESNRNQQQVLVAAFYHSCTQERMGEKSKQKCKLIVQYILQNSGLMSFYISLPNYGLCWKTKNKKQKSDNFFIFSIANFGGPLYLWWCFPFQVRARAEVLLLTARPDGRDWWSPAPSWPTAPWLPSQPRRDRHDSWPWKKQHKN